MTAQLLTSELSTLFQESKRKNPELRAAAEKSLNDLNNLPRTSEAQIIADLRCRPTFVKPFLLACGTRNPKFAGNAAACLQRLIVANALSKDTLSDVVEALRDCSNLALDIQLKLLQALPSLLQNYGEQLTGSLLIATFQLCFLLYGNKTAVVANLSAAALQQLIDLTFERAVSTGDSLSTNGSFTEVSVGDGTVSIGGSRLDAYRVMDDICLLTEGHKPKHIQGASLMQNFGLELLESIISKHADTIRDWPEQMHLLQIRLMPFLTRILSEKSPFGTTVRCMRLAELSFKSLLLPLASECEILLSLLNHLLDPDNALPWKRALCLETFKSMHAEPKLIRQIYSLFDNTNERRNTIRDHLGTLVRLASEKPAAIGLSSQSSIPSASIDDSGEQAAMQAGGLVGSIGAAVTTIDVNTPGISTRWSNIKTPFLDQLDKHEPAPAPITYIYSLTLVCLTSFEDGLARYLLPFTVPNEKKAKKRQPRIDIQKADSSDSTRPAQEELLKSKARKAFVNPLSLGEHSMFEEISIAASMVEQCWPALLAASSTFFNASMDSENFHMLIRSFQKFTQIAGLLDFTTPRDAFLTTLGKHALPVSKAVTSAAIPVSTPNLTDEGSATEYSTDNSRDPSPSPSRPTVKRQQTLDIAPKLDSRHLLCLRALLNLGIALGPLLAKSWAIVFETLQQAEILMSVSGTTPQRLSSRSEAEKVAEQGEADDLGVESAAAQTAASRLFESTGDLNDEAFIAHLTCLCELLQDQDQSDSHNIPSSSLSPVSPNPGFKKHQKLRSISGSYLGNSVSNHETTFALEKIKQVTHCNVLRLVDIDPKQSGWDLLSRNLMTTLTSASNEPSVRIGAANTLTNMLVLTAVSDGPKSPDHSQNLKSRSLIALLDIVRNLYKAKQTSRADTHCETEIHRVALDGLRAILDHCGDSLTRGWTEVFQIIQSTFENIPQASNQMRMSKGSQPRSPTLLRTSFGSLELICSDFLSSVPHSNFSQLLDTLYYFTAQTYDLNVSLTTATFFRTTSDHLLQDIKHLDVKDVPTKTITLPLGQDDTNPSTSLLWLSILAYLIKMTGDPRMEARNSNIHTIFKILDSQGDRLSHQSLPSFFDIIIAPLLHVNQHEYSNLTLAKDEEPPESSADWNKTAVLLLDGIVRLFSSWLDKYAIEERLAAKLHDLLCQLDDYFDRKTLVVTKAAFGGISKLLSEIEESTKTNARVINKVWQVWLENSPADSHDPVKASEDNNDTLLAHIFCLGQLLRLTGHRLENQDIENILERLHIATVRASASVYSTNIDAMTPVQKAVLESMKMLPRKGTETDRLILEFKRTLINLAYSSDFTEQPSHASYVAMSKASMGLIEIFLRERLQDKTMKSESELPSIALAAVRKPLLLKYKWRKIGRDPSPWKKATTTAVSVLQMAAPVVDISNAKGRNFWAEAVSVLTGIVSADCSACDGQSNVREDEAFDIQAFKDIQSLMTAALGSKSVSDGLRCSYIESLFRNSLIHDPHPDDSARPGEELLSGLKNDDHFGRVRDLVPSQRARMSYLLLDELFDLVSVTDSPDRKLLAKAAAPYFILRIGLTLKTYIFDQPLRGRMPQPRSQKNEMFYIFKKLIEFETDPDAAPAKTGSPRQKWHFDKLYPFLLRALKAAWRDEKMTEAIMEVLEAKEADFEI